MALTLKKKVVLMAASFITCAFMAVSTPAKADMVIESLDGPITQNEIDSFKAYINTLQPAVWPFKNLLHVEYTFGISSETIQAMGLMYELTGDIEILDRMIYFCDVLLSERNDILAAPFGQRTSSVTNTIAPIIPNTKTGPAESDSANGEHFGHLAYAAKLILQNPSIWNTPVPGGDIYGHGATYKERAMTFMNEADHVIDEYTLKYLLGVSNGGRYFFDSRQPVTPGEEVPWNQQMMFTYGLSNQAAAHEILNDKPALVAQYDAIVQANIDWFLKDDSAKTIYTNSSGNISYNWKYRATWNSVEDYAHSNLDVSGVARAYLSGRYGITADMIKPFASTLVDVIRKGPNTFAGRVDGENGAGHADIRTHTVDGFLLTSQLRPDRYYDMVGANVTPEGYSDASYIKTSNISRILWAKNQRYNQGYKVKFSPFPGESNTSQTVTLTSITSGASIRYTTDGSTPTATSGTLYTGPFTVDSTTTIKAVSYTTEMTSPVSIATYYITALSPTISVPGGRYSSSQSVTLSSGTSGATIKYTVDGSTPSDTNGIVYTGPVTISADTTLRAVAYTSSLSPSRVATAFYDFGTFTSKPTFSIPSGTYTDAQTIAISSTTSGASIRYTTDGTTPSKTVGTLYTGPLTISTGTTLQAIAYSTGNVDSLIASASYNIGGPAAAPTFSIPDGSYSTAQTVALSSTTPNTIIYFTLDGSSPTTVSNSVYVYSGPFTIKTSTTVKAYATGDDITGSSISSAAYTITSTDTQAPKAPTNLTATAVSSDTIKLSWSAPTDNVAVTGYDIYRGATLIGSTTSTSYNDTGLDTGTSYNYRIKAKDAAANKSAASTTTTVSTLTANLALNKTYASSTFWGSSFTAVKSFDGNETTRWSSGSGAVTNQWISVDFGTATTFNQVVMKEISYQYITSYVLQSSNDGTNYTDIPGTAGTTIGSFKNITFADTNARYFRLFVYIGNPSSTINEIGVYNTPDIVPPTAPINLAATPASTSQINLSWTASTDNKGVTGYDIYRNDVLIGSSTNASYSDSGLNASTSYTYHVKSKDAAGLISTRSTKVTAITLEDANIARGKTYSASSGAGSFAPSKMFDANTSTLWSATSKTNQWVTIDFGTTRTFNQIVLKEITYQRITSYKLQISSDGTSFTDISGTAGTTVGTNKVINISSTNARYLRLFVDNASNNPTMNEMEAYNN